MKNPTVFAKGRKHEVVSIGRLAVDLYSNQYGCDLEDASSFAKYLGGSSGNVAFGCARLGLRSAMITRVGNEQMGRFLVKTLADEGCDVSQIKVDPARMTALAILGIKDRQTFPLLFYRDNCADMAFCPEDVDESFIADCMALHITGTHFSKALVRAGSLRALEYAHRHNVRTILDIDYRPVLWGLTTPGDGETRYIPSREVTTRLQEILGHFDLIVGTEAEFEIAGGVAELIPALREVRRRTSATLIVKLGPLGCAIVEGEVPDRIEDAFSVPSPRVEVLNVLGAGDAFLAGFFSGWLRGLDYDICCRRANAAGALVVSRHACAPAMPTKEELDYFLEHVDVLTEPANDSTLNWLHHVTPKRHIWNDVFIFAFDHRSQLYDLACQLGVPETRLRPLKRLLVETVARTERRLGLYGSLGALIDDQYGEDALHAATGRGWWLGRPVEQPGTNPVIFELGSSIGSVLVHWPKEQVVKCLIFYHPDDLPERRLAQESQVRTLCEATNESGHELLLELIPAKGLPSDPDTILRTMTRFYNLGIHPDWWKLPPTSAEQWARIDELIESRDPYSRGVVMLGLNAPIEQLIASFEEAKDSRTCCGFAVGRSIFQDPTRAWLMGEIDDEGLIDRCCDSFEQLIIAWQRIRSRRRPPRGQGPAFPR
ncbi:bifunctional 5-dehydro-2-deoxygluconokinase/5-dehydro-2-deoxyphosphogluconate aldolase [Propionivibrio soli]|uniref:bifunctional 5-dehydro-2-deoxygluconokinase/5-dehydro-2- deoxyphosphogluconate aldolase n=1 Tax=Propionivibrio soli TaxID=2976531 RepID=UPI0021E8F03B|nr:5-dehydro-2-deoxygluconokinase [Propionivibrio soli]